MAEGMSREQRELAGALTSLGPRIEYPATPDLAAQVGHRLRREPAPPGVRGIPRLLSRRGLAIAALVLLVALAAATLTPGVRSAVAGWLGVLGIEIRVENDPSPPAPGVGDLGLGHESTLEGARRAVSFPVASLHAPGFTAPDDVLLGKSPVGGQVSFLFRPRPGLPDSAGTGVGLLLSQFRASLGEALIKKVVSTDTSVEPVALGDGGYWIAGRPHFIAYVDAAGRVREETTRLAANTLVWEEDGVTYRLESSLAKARVLRLARAVG